MCIEHAHVYKISHFHIIFSPTPKVNFASSLNEVFRVSIRWHGPLVGDLVVRSGVRGMVGL